MRFEEIKKKCLIATKTVITVCNLSDSYMKLKENDIKINVKKKNRNKTAGYLLSLSKKSLEACLI